MAQTMHEAITELATAETALRDAIVSLWTREESLSDIERIKLTSLLLNLKSVWLAYRAPDDCGASWKRPHVAYERQAIL
jgi:hypothetical protein